MIAEYGDGSRKGFILIPEGMDRKGWRSFAETIKVLGYVKSSVPITNNIGSFDYGTFVEVTLSLGIPFSLYTCKFSCR